jgi:hypothetical protein
MLNETAELEHRLERRRSIYKLIALTLLPDALTKLSNNAAGAEKVCSISVFLRFGQIAIFILLCNNYLNYYIAPIDALSLLAQ